MRSKDMSHRTWPKEQVALALALALAPACRPRGPVNLCPGFEVASVQAKESEDREVDPMTWLAEMLPGFERTTATAPAELRDCRGRRVEAPAFRCEGDAEPALLAAPRPLTAADLVFSERENNYFLLWAQGQHYTSGEALGPVALAQWTPRGALVLSVGSLRGPAGHVRLRLEPLGDHEVLVVEGDLCPEGQAKCRRLTRLVPRIDGHFVDPPLRDPGGGCQGPAAFPLSGEAEVALASGLVRRFRLQRSVIVKDGVATVFEEAVVTDVDPRQVDSPGTEFRRSSKERSVRLGKDGLVIEPGIWEETLREDGSIRPSDFSACAPRPGDPSARAPWSVDALGPVDLAPLGLAGVLDDVEVDRLHPPPLLAARDHVDVVGLGERLDLAEAHLVPLLLGPPVDHRRLVALAQGEDRELVELVLGADEADAAGDLVADPLIEGHPEDRHAAPLRGPEDLPRRAPGDRQDVGLADPSLLDLAVDLEGLLRHLLLVEEDRLAVDEDPQALGGPLALLDLLQLLRRQLEAARAAGVGEERGDGERGEERQGAAESRRRARLELGRGRGPAGITGDHPWPRTLARGAAGVNGRRAAAEHSIQASHASHALHAIHAIDPIASTPRSP